MTLGWWDEVDDRSENCTVLAVEETGVMSIKLEGFLQQQGDSPFCKQAAETAGRLRSQYAHDRNGFPSGSSDLMG